MIVRSDQRAEIKSFKQRRGKKHYSGTSNADLFYNLHNAPMALNEWQKRVDGISDPSNLINAGLSTEYSLHQVLT